jgi:hypothetical protein
VESILLVFLIDTFATLGEAGLWSIPRIAAISYTYLVTRDRSAFLRNNSILYCDTSLTKV